ncbi:MAG: nucleoside hydrolase [Candidatus Brachytrichaceae bacterium NZ_4S206]
MPTKLILDTDIGSDIDDAVCLAYLLAQPACELLGITTVTGEAVKRAQMASALCKLAGRRVPIYPGADNPLLIPQKQPQAQQAVALARWKHDSHFPMNEAVDFLRRTIRKHPGEITLLAIGPLTNIGLLFALDPEIPRLLRQLVLMCGVFTEGPDRGLLEWNAMLDPHATAMVYRAPVKVNRSIGLDVTLQVKMPADEARARFTHKLLRPVLDFAEVWFKSADQITFHDPLAATTIFDPRICKFQRGAVAVELENAEQRGRTVWQPGAPKGRHAVALQVDAPRFFRHYFSVFR